MFELPAAVTIHHIILLVIAQPWKGVHPTRLENSVPLSCLIHTVVTYSRRSSLRGCLRRTWLVPNIRIRIQSHVLEKWTKLSLLHVGCGGVTVLQWMSRKGSHLIWPWVTGNAWTWVYLARELSQLRGQPGGIVTLQILFSAPTLRASWASGIYKLLQPALQVNKVYNYCKQNRWPYI